MSHVSHLPRPTEIQNSTALAKPAADRAVACRESEILQQQNGGGVVSTQIGHTPVRLDTQGQTAVQCRKNEISQQQKNSSRAILTQFGHEPGRLELRARQQFSTDKTRICSSRTVSAGTAIRRSSRTVAGQCQIRSGMHPFRLEVATTESREIKVVRHVTFNRTHKDSEHPSVSKTSSRPSSSVQTKRSIATAKGWRGSFNPNRSCTRSGGSPGPDSSSV